VAKISEVIERLQELIDKHGDLLVLSYEFDHCVLHPDQDIFYAEYIDDTPYLGAVEFIVIR